jgi:hypothetical protein
MATGVPEKRILHWYLTAADNFFKHQHVWISLSDKTYIYMHGYIISYM